MSKFIVVQGPGSTGKTSAINAAMKTLGIDFSESPVGDIFCVTRVRVGTSNALVGVCVRLVTRPRLFERTLIFSNIMN